MKSIITFFLLFIGICNFSLARQEFGKQAQSVISEFDKLAQTSPMGWNSWNKFGCNVSEKVIKEMADAIASYGMKPVADYVHSLGLKFGIYSCAGSKA